VSWETAEKGSLAASAALLVGCAAVGFRYIATPYFRGYLSTAGALLVFSRLAAAMGRRATPAPG
jgi:hypothetical protein